MTQNEEINSRQIGDTFQTSNIILKQMSFLNGYHSTLPYVFPVYDRNFLIAGRKQAQSYDNHIFCVSPLGKKIKQLKFYSEKFQIDMVTDRKALILRKLPSHNQLKISSKFVISQWDLQTEQTSKLISVKIQKEFQSAQMYLFQETTLVCFCGKNFKEKKGRTQNQNRYESYIYLAYYKYPFQKEKNQPYLTFQSNDLSENLGQYFEFEKMNNRSMIGIRKVGSAQNRVKFYTYQDKGVQDNFQLNQINFESQKTLNTKILQMWEVKPGFTYLSLELFIEDQQMKQIAYNQYLFTKFWGKNQITKIQPCLSQNHRVQFRNSFKIQAQFNSQDKTIPRYYLDPENFDILGREDFNKFPYEEFSSLQEITVPAYDPNIQIQSTFNKFRRQFNIEVRKLTEFQYGRRTILAFLFMQIEPAFDDDLLEQVLDLAAGKQFVI